MAQCVIRFRLHFSFARDDNRGESRDERQTASSEPNASGRAERDGRSGPDRPPKERRVSTPVVILGLGELGEAIARAVLSLRELSLAGAVDRDPRLARHPLGEALGQFMPPEVVITDVPEEAYERAQGGIVVHATGARLAQAAEEVESALRAKLSVVSTCAELAWPWVRHPQIAARLDKLATRHGVSVVGVSVGAGFVFDRLGVTLAQATGQVERVETLRVVDASMSRESIQRRLGVRMSEADFHRSVVENSVGFQGLMESAALVAMGVGRLVDEVEEDVRPVFAQRPLRSLVGPVRVGEIAGVHQTARALEKGREVAKVELVLALGADEPRDEVKVFGQRSLELVVPGGVPGDGASAWLAANACVQVARGVEAGLLTSLDLSLSR